MNIAKYLLIAICIFVGSTAASAQSGVIRGFVFDSQTQEPLGDAAIKNMNGQLLTTTNSKGRFSISSEPDQDKVLVSLLGYKTQTIDLGSHEGVLNIQLDADALTLTEVRVLGFSDNKTIRETAGSVALVTTQEILRGNAMSLQSSFNSIPGVRMDQSTLSEARISIRGIGVRSSFGIRNLKIYVNEIPVTEADGTTRIEALDVNSIGRAEIIKGPASSIYGAGTGGVINFSLQRSPYQEQSVEISGLSGTYGLSRLTTAYRSGGDMLNSYVSYGWQEYGGYREHSTDMRRFITGNFQLFPDRKRMITLLVNRSTQHSQIPGSLTGGQVISNPVQANAGNLDKAAGRYQNWTRIGLGQQYMFNDKFSNSSSIFSYFYDLDHPLAFAYIRNYYQSYGGRTKFVYDPGFTVLPTRFTVGAEMNQGLTKGIQYVNNQGKEGAINSNVDYRNTQYSFFYQSETNIGHKTSLVLGISYNGLDYDIKDYLVPSRSGVKKFKGQAAPRVALSHNFSQVLSLHASISSGFSPPTTSEIRNVDGSVNSALQAEKGLNYEINAKGTVFGSRLSYDLALFKMDMKGELIGQAIQQGITIYNNSGKTSHDGLELALSWQPIRGDDHKNIAILRPFASLTYSDFKFKKYEILNSQGQLVARYDGNPLTGIAPWVVNAGLDLETRFGLYVYGSYYYSDKLPLNDEATVFNPAFRLLNTKIGYKKTVGSSFELNLYGGIDNLLNESYTSIASLNAVGFGGGQPAYFNPSPKRNGYGGLNIKYKL